MDAALRRAIAQILKEDDLPPDMLSHVGTLLRKHEDADEMYRWTMKLSPYIRSDDIRAIARLLRDALRVLSEKEISSETAATLSREARTKIQELSESDAQIAGPATYVLGFDAITRAYNRIQAAPDATRSYE